MRIASLLCAMLIGAAHTGPVLAGSLDGLYARPFPHALTFRLTGVKAGRFSGSVSTRTPHCRGRFAGTGTRVGDLITFRDAGNPERICTIGAKVDAAPAQVTLSEDGCADFHGAGCGFAGVVTRVRR